MKRFALILSLLLMAAGLGAQNSKRSIAFVQESGDNYYQIFSYDAPDGSRGYYLGMGKPETAGASEETFVLLGTNVNDAVESLKSIYSLYGAAVGDTREFKAKTGAKLPEGDFLKAKVQVEKKQGTNKTQLSVSCKSGSKTLVTKIEKNSVKSLQKFLSSYQKRHPDN